MSNSTGYNFAGKVVFISGASSGIGKATAMAFASAKAKLFLVDKDEALGLELAKRLSSEGSEVLFQKCDISKAEDVETSLKLCVEKFGGLDCAFNNAGIEGVSSAFTDTSEAIFDKVIATNLKGTWLCMKQQIPLLLQRKGGAIVNCSSIAGLVGFQGSAAYVASKHAVLGITKTAALEYAKANIRVNAVCPGVIQTPMIDRVTKGNPQMEGQLAAGEPMGRVGRPEEIANAVLWLCSEQSSFVTGESLVVDGGWTAQ